MKKIYTILLILAVGTTMVTAQNSKTKKADQYYDRLKYTDAAEAYQKLLKRGEASTYVYERLGNSYYFVNDTKQAETYYKRVVKGKNVDPEIVYNYAQTLKANGKLSDYNTYMKKFSKMKPSDSRAVAFMKNPDYLPKIIDENAQKFTATNLEAINTEYSEFGGTVAGNDFYFASGRNTNRKSSGWNDERYFEIYQASIIGGVEKDADLLKGDVNTKYHESTPAITADGKRMYFDRSGLYNGKVQKDKEGVSQLNIYYAENINGKWTNIQAVPFNNEEYSTSHPALSPDGSTLYFTSDRPGGQGMADIYKVSISANGTFGKPENLGDKINTEGKEGFPFVDSNGTLYFSSDGHLGMGGLDVFSAEAKGSEFGKVTNMGLGVNSSADDFAFRYNPTTGEGYVSSDRKGGKGSDDIYSIKRIETCEVNLIVQVVDANTKKHISGARLDLFDDMENKLKSKSTNATGNGNFELSCDQAHVVQAFKEGYESNAASIGASKKGDKRITIALRPIEELIVDEKVVLNPILYDYDKSNVKPQAAFELDKLVELMKRNPSMVVKVEAHTDSRGNATYNKALSERRAQSAVQYIMTKGIAGDRISGEGFGSTKPAVDCGANCTDAQHQQNRRSEFIIIQR